ncbi:Rab family GTPase [Nonlabens ponticola]|uniref:GTP-binding protein n=1 Tax=Nonlabens ponticola TaxID=2496866 RepID=A0A3S9MWG2_9FLAO|nr:Rab family GTPase [Nonlabens ponticola]AZQ43482.1 GTP-binding protein [Nonlabens ponticola]
MKTKKIVVLGLFGVGKTSLLRKYVEGLFSEDYKVTIGVHILKKTVVINDEEIKLILWDTEGTENIDQIRNSYLKGAHGFIYVGDVTRPNSYARVKEDKEYLEKEFDNVPILVALNKTDLLTPGTIKQKAAELDFADFMVSAKEDSNVNRLFEKMAKMIV